MKWLRRAVIAVFLLACGVVAAALYTAMRSERPVGFQISRAVDTEGRPFAVAIWYPTQARTLPTTLLGVVLMDVARDAPVAGSALPLVVVSHGNGGGPASHADLALSLASAGYVVAAPMHTGDNYADQGAVGSAALFSGRNRELRATVDHMLKTWTGHANIDPARIGAFGFSAGGFTVLTAAGASPDLNIVASHCVATPEFACDVLRQAGSPLLAPGGAAKGGVFVADPRIRAAVVAAPGLGFTMTPDSLSGVRVPVQLWSGDKDASVPYASNTKPIRDALGARAEFHSVAGAGHFSFLTPCGLIGPPALCADEGGFDRRAFHADMNAKILAFFEKSLRKQ
jgi:predicted dienelactone hydrolase